MTAHPDPPLREELAREMFGLARTGPGPIAFVDKTRLHNYALLAEEIIQLQSRMLIRDQAQHDDQADEIARLRTQNASLRALVIEAIDVGQNGDQEAMTIIRKALESTP